MKFYKLASCQGVAWDDGILTFIFSPSTFHCLCTSQCFLQMHCIFPGNANYKQSSGRNISRPLSRGCKSSCKPISISVVQQKKTHIKYFFTAWPKEELAKTWRIFEKKATAVKLREPLCTDWHLLEAEK